LTAVPPARRQYHRRRYESDSPSFDVVTTDLSSFLALLRHAVESFAVIGEIVDL
jgi:hypothetical protein